MSGFFTETDNFFSPVPVTGDGLVAEQDEPSYQKVPAGPEIS